MPNINAHIIIIDGAPKIGKKMFAFELALALIYNNQKTAILLPLHSELRQTLEKRKSEFPYLPSVDILSEDEFYLKANNYNAVIIPTTAKNDLAVYANTFITLISQNKKTTTAFKQNTPYLNTLWELKKKIAATNARSLDWVVCENNLKEKTTDTPSEELLQSAKLYGFRLCPPLNRRKAYADNTSGISAQDKITPELKPQLTYDDICAKREIIKLAEFIFS